jgi:3-oxo-5-alpha-steroid 4-dehydrogenase 1
MVTRSSRVTGFIRGTMHHNTLRSLFTLRPLSITLPFSSRPKSHQPPMEQQQEDAIHSLLTNLMVLSSIVTLIILQYKTAPFGKHTNISTSSTSSKSSNSDGFGFKVPAKVAWILMESPALIFPIYYFTQRYNTPPPSSPPLPLPNLIIQGCFILHYVNRAFIYPFRMRGGSPMPFSIMLMGALFCLWNGFIQAKYLLGSCPSSGGLSGEHSFPQSHLSNPVFLFGFFLFGSGLTLNLQADNILRSLRPPGGGGLGSYKIPYGGLFKYVSGGNFLAEIVEWIGYGMMMSDVGLYNSNTLTTGAFHWTNTVMWVNPGLAFAVFTFCNTAPRAAAHHQWYLRKFEGYNKLGRKGVIPFVW